MILGGACSTTDRAVEGLLTPAPIVSESPRSTVLHGGGTGSPGRTHGPTQRPPALSPGADSGTIEKTEVARGENATAKWVLFASRQNDDLCMTIAVATIDGEARSDGCDLELPIDFAQMQSSGGRFAFGPVTADAAVVRIVGERGQELDVPVTKSSAGFSHGFYLAPLAAGMDVTAVVALDSAGAETARLEVDDAIGG